MMVRMLTALAAFLGAAPVLAVDLLDIYYQARISDTRYAAARAHYRVMQERVPQARAGIRPYTAFVGTSGYRDVGAQYQSPGVNSGRSNYNGRATGSDAIRPMWMYQRRWS